MSLSALVIFAEISLWLGSEPGPGALHRVVAKHTIAIGQVD